MSRHVATLTAFLSTWLLYPSAWAQECPEGYTCLSEQPTHCLSAEQLDRHEENLRECDRKRRELRGRFEEARDALQPLQSRVETLAGEKAILKERNRNLEADLSKWYRKPIVWIGISLAAGGAGYGIGRLLD